MKHLTLHNKLFVLFRTKTINKPTRIINLYFNVNAKTLQSAIIIFLSSVDKNTNVLFFITY